MIDEVRLGNRRNWRLETGNGIAEAGQTIERRKMQGEQGKRKA